MNDAILLLTFTGIFLIVGGIALGWVLRQLLARQFSCTLIFFIIWGSLFSLAPLVMGANSFAAMHAEFLIVVQVFVFLAAIAVTAFTPSEYLSAFASLPVAFIAFGGFLFLLGSAVFISMFRQDLSNAIVIGGVFAFVGGTFFVTGLVLAPKNR
jgi:hypothetical protein